MSGGHFEYQQYQIENVAREIDRLIESNDDQSLDQYAFKRGRGYPPEIIEKFREAAHVLRQGAEMAQRIDWLVSGDDAEESFLKRWEKEVRDSWAKEKAEARRSATACSTSLLGLAQNLYEWGRHYRKRGSPVSLSLFRAAAAIKDFAAGGGTVDQASTKLPSDPGGYASPNARAMPPATETDHGK